MWSMSFTFPKKKGDKKKQKIKDIEKAKRAKEFLNLFHLTLKKKEKMKLNIPS